MKENKHHLTSLWIAAASEIGPAHVKDDLPNQDAFFWMKSIDFCIAAIADGIGSKIYSDISSKIAVRAVMNIYTLFLGEECNRLVNKAPKNDLDEQEKNKNIENNLGNLKETIPTNKKKKIEFTEEKNRDQLRKYDEESETSHTIDLNEKQKIAQIEKSEVKNIQKSLKDQRTEQTSFYHEKIKKEIIEKWTDWSRPLSRNEGDTTLLFFLQHKDRTIIGQLGDGIILLKYKSNDKINPAFITGLDFNETTSLGSSDAMKQFCLKEFRSSDIDAVMLMTDGISEDIIKPKDFFYSVVHQIRDKTEHEASQWIKEHLKKWPTKYHSDDKTLLVIINDKGNKI